MSDLPQYRSILGSHQIRLMTILPGRRSDPLQCTLETVSLDSHLQYEAVSYVWGDESDRRSLEVGLDGQSTRTFSITSNLAIVLVQVRHEQISRVLWVDSICINQGSIQERNEQVMLMGQIYRHAQKVLISLGDDDETGSGALRYMEALGEAESKHEELKPGAQHSPWIRSDGEFSAFFGITGESDMSERLGIPSLNSADFNSFKALFQKPWFYRAWTWQESHLASEKIFHCGRQQWSGSTMQEILRILSKLRVMSGNGAYLFPELISTAPMIASRNFWRNETKNLEIMTLLSVRRGSGCKFPSDLVYSLLGAAERCPQLNVDYDLPFETVFVQLAKDLIDEYGDLSLFALIDGPRTESSLPSWVPDWRERRAETGMTGINNSLRGVYKINTKPLVKLLPDLRTLKIQGLYVDKIVAIRNPQLSEDDFVAKSFEKHYEPTNEPVEVALWRTRCRDLTLFEPNRPLSRWDPGAWERMQKVSANAHDIPEGRRQYAAMLTAVVEANQEKVLFKTDLAYMGFACKIIQEDDIVAHLSGGQYSVVLRPVNDGNYYQVVSECYIHGLMDEEDVSKHLAKHSHCQSPDFATNLREFKLV